MVGAAHEGEKLLGGESAEVADAQGRALAAQGDQLAHPLQLDVVVAHLVPRHGAALRGVVAAGHAQLDAVVDAGRAGQRELEDLGHAAASVFG